MNTRPGNDALKDFRGPEPVKGEDDEPISPPVTDDDGGAAPGPAAADDTVKVAGVDGAKDGDKGANDAPTEPTLSPGDKDRARIAEKFSKKRATEGTDDGSDMDFRKPENVYGKLAGKSGGDPPAEGDPPAANNTATNDKKPPETGASALEGDGKQNDATKPEPITLVVNGKTLTRSLAEVAALSDLTPEEVQADPKRARRYAQIELAKQEELREAKQIRRDQPARQPDDAGTRPASPAPNQERREAGNDGSDQPATPRQTSVEDAQQLIEDIQIGDPKDVAPKLAAYLDKVAKGSAAEVAQQSESQRVLTTEANANVTAVKDFIEAHPEVEGKDAISAAMGSGLVKEYKADLRTALMAEGETEASADALLNSVSTAEIKNAHLARRLKNDPHVRKIDKALMETVYEKVRGDFGLPKSGAPQNQQQGLNRQERKENLPHQPRRASVPPATTPAPPAPATRKQAVAEMAARTGRKVSTLAR